MITSRNNPEITEVAKLKQKKYRDNTDKYLIEGFKLVDEAINHSGDIEKIYVIPDALDKIKIPENIEIVEVSNKVLDKLSSQKNPEGIVAVLNKSNNSSNTSSRVLLLDNIQDPGNLGTIIRTADAAGFETVICSSDCADLYNEKTLRAAMGSTFHLDVLTNQDLSKQLEQLKDDSYETLAAVLDGEELILSQVKSPDKLAILVGNESHGIKPELVEICDKRIALPMIGQAESLNVAIAAGILMYAYLKNH